MYRGTRKLVPLFYNTILQKAKMQRSESRTNLLELCRATQHFDDENKNAKMQKCKTYRKLLIKYKIHFAYFAKRLHFLCKKVFLGLLAVGFFSLGFRILEFRHKY